MFFFFWRFEFFFEITDNFVTFCVYFAFYFCVRIFSILSDNYLFSRGENREIFYFIPKFLKEKKERGKERTKEFHF